MCGNYLGFRSNVCLKNHSPDQSTVPAEIKQESSSLHHFLELVI